jgi:alginate O-acetyltransferase complex protein AlgI
MVFSSPIFLFYFLPLVLVLYFIARQSIYLQNLILFISSLLFYFWGEKEYSILVLFSILINYSFGLLIQQNKKPKERKWILTLGLLINLSILIYFKYFNFITHELLVYFNLSEPMDDIQKIHLPLGISFFTFHGITYIVDIYRKEAEASSDLLKVSLYTLFFPQLIAGPIVRFTDIHKQLSARSLSSSQVNEGIKRFVIGLAKKVIIANSLGRISDHIFQLEIADLSTSLIWFGIIVFALQLYYDFSGYSDMAIGLAKLCGFEFKENFNFPFAARTLTDLWKRWHISLTSFFRNYVYIPLGGSQVGKGRMYFNLLFVFFLTGLWHGPSWNCILWGVCTGLFLLIEKLFLRKWIDKLPYVIANMYTFFLFITALLIFKIERGDQLADVLQKAFFLQTEYNHIYFPMYYITPDIAFVLSIAVLFAYPIHQFKYVQSIQKFALRIPILPQLVLLGLFILSLSILSSSTYNPFIYFKF